LLLSFKGLQHRYPFRDETHTVNDRDLAAFREVVEVIFNDGEHVDCELSILTPAFLVSIITVVHDLAPLNRIGVGKGRATCLEANDSDKVWRSEALRRPPVNGLRRRIPTCEVSQVQNAVSLDRSHVTIVDVG
jgi:hypothetical protein